MAKKSASRILWKSPPLPVKVFEYDEWVWRIRGEAQVLADSDEPSTKDLRYAFYRYNEATAVERDAMDTVFVWFTGYTLTTIVERTKESGGPEVGGF